MQFFRALLVIALLVAGYAPAAHAVDGTRMELAQAVSAAAPAPVSVMAVADCAGMPCCHDMQAQNDGPPGHPASCMLICCMAAPPATVAPAVMAALLPARVIPPFLAALPMAQRALPPAFRPPDLLA